MTAVETLVAEAEPTTTLSERDQKILEFERSWWRFSGAKEEAIAENFSLTSTRYYQILNALLDNPHALEFDPILVKRLRRARTTRRGARATRS